MLFSLRPLARSRRLLAMGVLAWLMLVCSSWAAAPMGMSGTPHSHAMHTRVAAASEHGHHDRVVKASGACCDDHAGCCGGLVGHACGCAAMYGTTLPPGAAVVAVPAAVTTIYAMPLPISVPSLNAGPPLRPPAV